MPFGQYFFPPPAFFLCFALIKDTASRTESASSMFRRDCCCSSRFCVILGRAVSVCASPRDRRELSEPETSKIERAPLWPCYALRSARAFKTYSFRSSSYLGSPSSRTASEPVSELFMYSENAFVLLSASPLPHESEVDGSSNSSSRLQASSNRPPSSRSSVMMRIFNESLASSSSSSIFRRLPNSS